MLKINIVCVGKLKEEYLRAACAEYLKRLSRFAKVEVCELAEGKTLKEEADSILRASKGRIVALCIEGEKLSSPQLAARIKEFSDRGEEATFIIGSSTGLDKSVKEAASFRLSMSDMTFPHMLARVMLLEQIYRSFMIISGGEYHK